LSGDVKDRPAVASSFVPTLPCRPHRRPTFAFGGAKATSPHLGHADAASKVASSRSCAGSKRGLETGYRAAVLETGDRQPEAVRLYEACGYAGIPPYGPYAALPNSICLRRRLAA
jgi:hypothetical protein